MYNNKFKKLRISLGSAISRQRLAGCTMVFDRALKIKCNLFRITREMGNIISHDAAVYYICLLTGGNVLFDKKSHICFRRHKGTVTEHGKETRKRINSVVSVLREKSNQKYMQVKYLNKVYYKVLSDENKNLIDTILSYRNSFMKTLKFAIDKRKNCGLISVDMVNFIAICMRKY